jgi:CubicO group peptidase (beta-lactamase class C family)
VLKYFDVAKVKNVDNRKRHVTVENLLTMTSGKNSEELFYPDNSDATENDFVHMEASDDWVQYAIDEPIVEDRNKETTRTTHPSIFSTILLQSGCERGQAEISNRLAESPAV